MDNTTRPAEEDGGNGDQAIDVAKAMRRAYHLGQTYWQQADSEYLSQQRKSDETQAKFDRLLTETVVALAAPDAAAAAPNQAMVRNAAEVLVALDVRLRECFGSPITAEDAYDSMYQQMVTEALGAPADQGDQS